METLTINLENDVITVAGRQLIARLDVPEYDTRIGVVGGGGGGISQTDADMRYTNISGDTMSGPLVLSGNAATALQAVPKQQLDAAVAAVVPGISQATADGRYIRKIEDKTAAAVEFTDPTNQRIGEFVIDEDASDPANWPDRFGFRFKPNSGAEVRTGGFNEYGEGRFDAAKTNTIPLRAHGNFAGTHTAALFECRVKRGGATVFSVAADGATTMAGNATAKNLTGCIALATGAALPTGLPNGTVVVRY